MNDYITATEILDFVYCNRRWYLHTLEQKSNENEYIIKGNIAHQDVHKSNIVYLEDKIVLTNVVASNDSLGLTCICDKVELIFDEEGISTKYSDKKVVINLIEFKRGKLRNCVEYKAQVVAQVFCIEQLFNVVLDEAFIYYIESEEFQTIKVTTELRNLVQNSITKIRLQEFDNVVYNRKCKGCSMVEYCDIRTLNIENYLKVLWE